MKIIKYLSKIWVMPSFKGGGICPFPEWQGQEVWRVSLCLHPK